MISEIVFGEKHKKCYTVSIIILIYEQPIEKILLTLASVLEQRNINFEIVISDDGSNINHLNECICFMKKCGFNDYVIIYHDENQGTMKNFRDAVANSKGEYVKDLGPGDCFSSEDSLYLWVNDIKEKNSELSFCDSIYYKKNKGKYESIIEVAHPQNPSIYYGKKSKQKKYYLLYNDIFLGASLLICREVLEKYIILMEDEIKYAEDNLYRIMLLDEINCSYFSYEAIYYEWGEGISTNDNSEFKKALKKDWEITTNYIYDKCKNNYIENMIKNYYGKRENCNLFIAIIYVYFAKICIFFYNRHNNRKRMTKKGSVGYLYKLEKQVIAYGK